MVSLRLATLSALLQQRCWWCCRHFGFCRLAGATLNSLSLSSEHHTPQDFPARVMSPTRFLPDGLVCSFVSPANFWIEMMEVCVFFFPSLLRELTTEKKKKLSQKNRTHQAQTIEERERVYVSHFARTSAKVDTAEFPFPISSLSQHVSSRGIHIPDISSTEMHFDIMRPELFAWRIESERERERGTVSNLL